MLGVLKHRILISPPLQIFEALVNLFNISYLTSNKDGREGARRTNGSNLRPFLFSFQSQLKLEALAKIHTAASPKMSMLRFLHTPLQKSTKRHLLHGKL